MSVQFQPEIGQACFGNPSGEFKLGNLEGLVIREIASLMNYIDGVGDPYASCDWKDINGVFEIHPYWWRECEIHEEYNSSCSECQGRIRPNFKCGDFEVRWYKHLGRGMSVNKVPSLAELKSMFDKCRATIKIKEEN